MRNGIAFLMLSACLLLCGQSTLAMPSSKLLGFEAVQDSGGRLIALVNRNTGSGAAASENTPDYPARALQFLNLHKSDYGILSPEVELRVFDAAKPAVIDKNGGAHVRLLQYTNGGQVLVPGAELTVHFSAKGRISSVTGAFLAGLSKDLVALPARGSLGESALSVWRSEHDASYGEPVLLESRWVYLDSRLFPQIGSNSSDFYLEVRVAGQQPVQAASGEMLRSDSDETYYMHPLGYRVLQLDNMRNDIDVYRRVYDCGVPTASGGCRLDITAPNYPADYLFGRSEAQPIRGSFPADINGNTNMYYQSEEVDQLYDYFEQVHKFWQQWGNIDGANRMGGTVPWRAGYTTHLQTPAFIHRNSNWSSCNTAGAAFNSYYGRFDYCLHMPVPDVVPHEYMHAVVRYTYPEGGTIYQGQTGAIEEASADILGELGEKCISRQDPLFDLDCVTGVNNWIQGTGHLASGEAFSSAFGATRNLKYPEDPTITNPTSGEHFPSIFGGEGYYCGAGDFGGAHANSTVLSKAAYLMAMGSGDTEIPGQEDGRFNGCDIQGQGFENIVRVFIHAWLGNYFPRTVNFNQAVVGLQLACADIYPAQPEICDTVTRALQAVEMDQSDPCVENAEPHHTPACAAPAIVPGVIGSARPTQAGAELFSPGEYVYGIGASWSGTTEVDVYLAPHDPARQEGAALNSLLGDPIRAELNEAGGFVLPLWLANQTGFFDIVVDANLNGVFNSASDRSASFEVRALTDADGLCYAGERWQTSENCRAQPIDCACTGVRPYCTSFGGDHPRCLSLAQIRWYKAHPIEEGVEVIQP